MEPFTDLLISWFVTSDICALASDICALRCDLWSLPLSSVLWPLTSDLCLWHLRSGLWPLISASDICALTSDLWYLPLTSDLWYLHLTSDLCPRTLTWPFDLYCYMTIRSLCYGLCPLISGPSSDFSFRISNHLLWHMISDLCPLATLQRKLYLCIARKENARPHFYIHLSVSD
jgi:hypothetical protein